MKNLRTLIIGIGLTACIAGNAVAFADAATKVVPAIPSTGFTVYPTFMHGTNKSWIMDNVAPGGTLKESVTLENLTGTAQEVSISFREAAETNGTFLPIDKEPYKNLGNWITISGDTYALTPHEKRRIPVEIKIPGSAAQQKYEGVIYAVQRQTGQELNVVTRIGVRTYITVTPAFDIQTNTFSSGAYKSSFFLAFSLIGVLGSILYNTIYILESRKIKTANK